MQGQESQPIEQMQTGALRDDEIDLRELFLKIWDRKYMVLAVTLLVPALILGFHLFKKTLYVPAGYEFPVMFSFAGVQKGEYPNGERFIIHDLINAEVLWDAMQQVGAPEDLVNATDIHAGNGLTAAVKAQITEKLQARKLTADQLAALSEALERLQAQARQYALLHVDPSRTSANAGQIQTYLEMVPHIWSDHAVQDMGVLEVDHQAVNNPFIFNNQASLIKEFFRFEGYLDLLNQSINELGKYGVANLSALSGPSNQRLSEVHLNLQSIRSEFDDLISMVPYAINGQKINGEESTADRIGRSLLAAKRLNLELERNKLDSMVKVYDESLALLGARSGARSAEGTAARQQFNAERNPNYAGGMYSPQLSDSMFESLLQLGKTVSDSEQRAMIISKRIEASEGIQNVNLRLARLSSTNGVDYQLLDKDSILLLLRQQVDLANRIQADIQAVSEQVSKQILGTSSVLWEPLGPVSEAAQNSLTLRRFVLQIGIALILGGMLALLLALVLPRRGTSTR